jgi:hypothetical protein
MFVVKRCAPRRVADALARTPAPAQRTRPPPRKVARVRSHAPPAAARRASRSRSAPRFQFIILNRLSTGARA